MNNFLMKACFTPCEPREHIIYSNTTNTLPCSNVVHFCSADAPNKRSVLTEYSGDTLSKYPFIFNRFNDKDYPIYQLNKCILSAQMKETAKQQVDQCDNQELISQIIQIVREKRGIDAKHKDILITHGSEDTIQLIASVLGTSNAKIGVEDPGHIGFAKAFNATEAQILPVKSDLNGVVPEAVAQCNYLCIMPSNHYPSTITMPLERRTALINEANINNTILIEDDFESDINFLENPIPALKSMDTSCQVVYMGNLSSSVSSDIQISYIIADSKLIQQFRIEQQLKSRQVSLYNQQVALNFITFGYYENHIRRVQASLERKWIAMINALESRFNGEYVVASPGSFFIGIKLPDPIFSQRVIDDAKKCDVMIDVKEQIFSSNRFNDHFITLGFSAIEEQKITAGVAKLSNIIQLLLTQTNSLSDISCATH